MMLNYFSVCFRLFEVIVDQAYGDNTRSDMLAMNCDVKSICRIAIVRGCDQYIAAITSIIKTKHFIIRCVIISETVGLVNGLRVFSQDFVVM